MVKITPRGISAAFPGILAAGSLLTLDRLPRGLRAIIHRLETDGSLKTHLLELGFVPGSPVSFLMSTPFGDPNVYALRGTSFALRKNEARCVVVTI